MSDAVQIIARGPRADCESAAGRLDAEVEGATYSIIEEQDPPVWRICTLIQCPTRKPPRSRRN